MLYIRNVLIESLEILLHVATSRCNIKIIIIGYLHTFYLIIQYNIFDLIAVFIDISVIFYKQIQSMYNYYVFY